MQIVSILLKPCQNIALEGLRLPIILGALILQGKIAKGNQKHLCFENQFHYIFLRIPFVLSVVRRVRVAIL